MSDVTLQKTSVFGYEAWRMQSDQIRVEVIPEAGAKIVSLYDKQAGIEWLVQPEHSNPFRVFDYGTEYNPNQCGGWDEMFPTILACPYPAPGPWQGFELPDHGEVWMMPWQDAGTSDDAIRLSVEGRALPYRLSRNLSFSSERTVRLEYLLKNLEMNPWHICGHPTLSFCLLPDLPWCSPQVCQK